MEAPTPDPLSRSSSANRMVRTTVFFPASLVAGVRAVASLRGTTSAAIIRSAVEAAVGGHRPPPRGGFL
ncbi:hypothetical protein QMG83_11235 [Salinibacterium sp. G-O1]|uniref:hypothetical protein n=1 Tax=Salinibacterium sp. G-O1 TaxID=3046208 RepID=UPI0024BAD616|nr:hypothetical protein [Salinibacterium sp. G-O1]MDJ0335797.1 hypothetical protein [Salinibacterium sp. G-O1]